MRGDRAKISSAPSESLAAVNADAYEARGIGVEGSLGPEVVSNLAGLAENLNYATFWFNVVGGKTDPMSVLWAILERTTSIGIGIGVLPLDEYPPGKIQQLTHLTDAESPRLILGIGSGRKKRGALQLVEQGIQALKSAAPRARVVVGAYGPNMLALAGRFADGVLLNWMTPDRVRWAREWIAQGRPATAPDELLIYLYHRAARGTGATELIRNEMQAYRRLPVHARHQAAMGFPALVGLAVDRQTEVQDQLRAYARLCTPVLRPIPINRDASSEWEDLIRFFAPPMQSSGR